jgi:hypothetical protein
MSVKVKNGTPVYGPSLCETCERALIIKGYRESEQVVVCQAAWPELQVMFPVRECSRYVSQGRQRLRDMEEIAWNLVPRGPKRNAGFVAPSGEDEEVREIELVLKEDE